MKKLVGLLLNVFLVSSLFAVSGKEELANTSLINCAVSWSYEKEWKAASSDQKIFLALTHNLMGSNGLSYTQLFPREKTKQTDRFEEVCANILRDSWGVTSAKDIPDALSRLDYNSSHVDPADVSGNYDKCVLILKENPDGDISKLATEHGLTPFQRQTLYFVRFFGEKLDDNDLIAYDLGRKLNILRWSLGCGYLDWNETWAYAKPIVDEVLARFDSFVDYTRSYVAGRLILCMNTYAGSLEYYYDAIKSAEVFHEKIVKQLFPQGVFRKTVFKKNPFDDMWDWCESFPTEYESFSMLYTYYYQGKTSKYEDIKDTMPILLEVQYQLNPKDLFYAQEEAIVLYKEASKDGDKEKLEKAYEILEGVKEYFERLPHNHWYYKQHIAIQYLVCVYTGRFDEIVSLYETYECISQEKNDNNDFQYAYALYALIKNTEPDAEKIHMRNKALAVLDRLALKNDISANLMDEIRSYGVTAEIPDDVEEIYSKAIEYYNNRQYQFAFTFFLEAAEKGHGLACNELGGCYLNGIGTQKNLELAFRYYSLAAERGVALGAYNVGICYALGEYVEKDMVKAARWIGKAAYDDCPVAAYTIADYYRLGNGVEKNENKAFQWMEKACQLEYPGAFSDLGSYYSLGIGCEVDQEKAIEYFLKGSDLGSSLCMRKLAICYENGNSVEKDINQAAWYFNQAAKQGDGYSMYLLGSLYETSIQLRDHLKTAFYWYEKGAEIRNGPALMRMGDAYYAGEYGYEQSYEHAVEYYYAAYEEGYAPAWVAMARILHFGHGVDKNDKLAWQFLQAAVNSEVDGAAEMMQNFGWSIDKPIE